MSEYAEWKTGWELSARDWTDRHIHSPDPTWPQARLRGYEAEAEHRGDWATIHETDCGHCDNQRVVQDPDCQPGIGARCVMPCPECRPGGHEPCQHKPWGRP